MHKSLNNCPVSPSTNKKGKNTAIVVKVEADIASATEEVPFIALEYFP